LDTRPQGRGRPWGFFKKRKKGGSAAEGKNWRKTKLSEKNRKVGRNAGKPDRTGKHAQDEVAHDHLRKRRIRRSKEDRELFK